MQVTTATRFDPRGNPYTVTLYSYFLGTNGPFTEELAGAENTPEKVSELIAARVAHLQAVGALPMAATGY
jgi:hypothetical protein